MDYLSSILSNSSPISEIILSNLSSRDILKLGQVNSILNQVCQDEVLWEKLFKKDLSDEIYIHEVEVSWKSEYLKHSKLVNVCVDNIFVASMVIPNINNMVRIQDHILKRIGSNTSMSTMNLARYVLMKSIKLRLGFHIEYVLYADHTKVVTGYVFEKVEHKIATSREHFYQTSKPKISNVYIHTKYDNQFKNLLKVLNKISKHVDSENSIRVTINGETVLYTYEDYIDMNIELGKKFTKILEGCSN